MRELFWEYAGSGGVSERWYLDGDQVVHETVVLDVSGQSFVRNTETIPFDGFLIGHRRQAKLAYQKYMDKKKLKPNI